MDIRSILRSTLQTGAWISISVLSSITHQTNGFPINITPGTTPLSHTNTSLITSTSETNSENMRSIVQNIGFIAAPVAALICCGLAHRTLRSFSVRARERTENTNIETIRYSSSTALALQNLSSLEHMPSTLESLPQNLFMPTLPSYTEAVLETPDPPRYADIIDITDPPPPYSLLPGNNHTHTDDPPPYE